MNDEGPGYCGKSFQTESQKAWFSALFISSSYLCEHEQLNKISSIYSPVKWVDWVKLFLRSSPNSLVFLDLKPCKSKIRLWHRRRGHIISNVCLLTTCPNAELILDLCQQRGRRVNKLQMRFCSNLSGWKPVVEMKDRLRGEPEG